jgi:uncharacterized protein (DUF2147 family)
MKKLFIAAALLMATTAAHAGNSISFEVNGHRIHIEAPKNCDQLSCIKVSAPDLSGFDFKGFNSKHDEEDVAARSDSPAPAPAAPAAPVAATTTPASNAVASTDSMPGVASEAPTAPSAAMPATPAPAPVAAAPVAAPAPSPTTPLGVWATEENKGDVRVESCGQNLCGYAVKTGEKILINMKSQDTKWVGQIHDPDSGRNYDSTIAMKGPNAMRVQGCAFGGMFCGGQTWKRIS